MPNRRPSPNSVGMTDAADINESIASSATGPKRVQVTGMGESEEHNLADQIAAAKYTANARAANGANGFGLRFVKMNPPGTQ